VRRVVVVIGLCGFLVSCGRNLDPPSETLAQIRSLMETGSYQKGLALGYESLKGYPHSKHLRMILGQEELDLQNYQKAVDVLSPALEEGIGETAACLTLGLSHFFLGHWKEAREFLERMRAAHQLKGVGLEILGYAAYYMGDVRSAAEILEEAAKARPNLETEVVRDVLRSLEGRSTTTTIEMAWHEAPTDEIRFCCPADWTRQDGEFSGQSGKISWSRFSGKPEERSALFLEEEILLRVTFHNASRHPLPEIFTGPYRVADEYIEEGEARVVLHATTVPANGRWVPLPRDSGGLARFLGAGSCWWILKNWDMIVQDAGTARTALHGGATYSLGELRGVDKNNHAAWAGWSMGIYDPHADAAIFLFLFGPSRIKKETEPLAMAIFNLAQFGERGQ